MPKSSSPTFQQMLAWLMTEVMFGRANFTITRGLRGADRVVLDTAPRFFDMTLGAHADSALMTAARIFDRRSGSVSIHELLSSALQHAGVFKHGTAVDVRKVVAEAKISISSFEPILKALRKRRNETMAHSDPGPMVDPHQYVQEGRVSYRELEGLFEQTGSILNKLSVLYRGASVVLDFDDVKDYEQALDVIADAKCEQARRYEADHKTPARFPRPRKCRERQG
jgi:hypothetical protein